MKTRNVSLLMVLPLMLGLASCSNSGSDGDVTSTTSSNSDGTVTITTSSSGTDDSEALIQEDTEITIWSITGKNNQAMLQNYINDFVESEPHVTVNNVIQTGMGYNELKDAVIKGFSADNYPDVVQCYPDHVAEYINYGKAVKLDPYIDNAEYGWTEEDKNDIYAAFLEEGQQYTVSGTYSVPYCKSTEALFYNEDVLIGLNLSTIDSTINNGNPLSKKYLESLTWEELFDKLCPAIVQYNDTLADDKKIIDSTNNKYSAVVGYDSDDNLFITLAKQYGIGYTSVDTTTGEASFDFGLDPNKTNMETLLTKWHTYATNGYIISKGSAENNYTDEYFTNNGLLFEIASTGGYKYMFNSSNPMNVGVAPIPYPEGKTRYTINQGPSLCILNHSDDNRKLASWLLYKTITNKENSLDWALNSGYMGIRKSAVESDSYAEMSDYTDKDEKTIERLAALNATYCSEEDVLNSLFTSPAFVGSSTARTQVGALMTKVLIKTNDITQIDSWFTEAYNNCLKAIQE